MNVNSRSRSTTKRRLKDEFFGGCIVLTLVAWVTYRDGPLALGEVLALGVAWGVLYVFYGIVYALYDRYLAARVTSLADRIIRKIKEG